MHRAANGIVKSSYFADEAGIVIIAEDTQAWIGSLQSSDGIMVTLEGSGSGYQFVPYDI
jgi:hypothetical protein